MQGTRKGADLGPATEVDIVMYKTITAGDIEMLRRQAESKGWKVKIGQKGYLAQANGFKKD